MMKNILLFFCLFALNNLILAQTYYVRLEDASGVNTDRYQDSLEMAAADLMNAFPSDAYRDSFRVYDFGFYLHQETYKEGYPEAMLQKIEEIQANGTPYYLLFGKQTDKTGIYTKIWVELKLPTEGRFRCWTETQRSVVQLTLQGAADGIENPGLLGYHDLEKGGMKALKANILSLLACCTDNNNTCNGNIDYEEIVPYLISQGFEYVNSYKIKAGNAPETNPFGTFQVEIIDSANLNVEVADLSENIRFKHLAELAVSQINAEFPNSIGVITKNSNFDNNNFSILKTYVESLGAPYVWWHIWDNPNTNEPDYCFIKKNLGDPIALKKHEENGGKESVTDCNPDWEICPCYRYGEGDRGYRSGLFFIMGTNQNQSWDLAYPIPDECKNTGKPAFQPNFIENINFLAQFFASFKHKDYVLNKCFDWSDLNSTFNFVNERNQAAARLVDFIIKYLPEEEKQNTAIPVTLIGYSHGGNVALQAIPEIFRRTGKKVNLITINTPASNEKEEIKIKGEILYPQRASENPNYSKLKESLGMHYHFCTDKDITVFGSCIIHGGHIMYYSNRSKNYKIDANCTSENNRHGNIYYLECFRNYTPLGQIRRQH